MKPRAVALGGAAFVAGAVLLGVEIAASRVVAPFFGNSLFVWGALIGVVLTGLAIGYWVGGALADRAPTPLLLVGVLGVGGGAVLSIPLLDDPVLRGVVSWDPGPRLDPLLAAAALFGPASVVLAAATPIAVRLLARSVASVGRTAGRLFAVSTAGSIAGTFATAFWLVPALGTDQLLTVAAAVLLGAAAVVALSQRRLVAAGLALASVVPVVGLAVSLAPRQGGTVSASALRNWSPVYRRARDRGLTQVADSAAGFKLVYRKETRYHRLTVVDDSASRYLRFDSSFQSAMYLKQPFRTRFAYTDYLALGLAYDPSARDVLFVGLGGGSAPKRLWRDFPRVRIDVAELDPAVVDVGYRYFHVPRSPRLRISVEDGRRYLQRHTRRYDVVAIDAFYADSIPFHLTTREFVELVHQRLRPGGVVVVNAIGALRGDGSQLLRSLYRTYASVFPTVLVHPVYEEGDRRPGSVRNVILVATDSPAPETGFLARRWRTIRAARPGARDLSKAIRDRYPRPLPVDDVPTLTDDYAPTDALLLD